MGLLTWTVDVWHSITGMRPEKSDWRRYVIAADDAVTAALVACQMASRFGTAVEATVIDWPEDAEEPPLSRS